MTATTISIVIGAVLLVLILLAFDRMRRNNSGNQDQTPIMNAVPEPEKIAEGKLVLEQIIKNHPRVKELAEEAKQNGATYFEGAGPAIAFYRIHDGKVEECFAEFTPGKGYHEWVWPPSEWHTGKKSIPNTAKPIP